MKKIGIVLFLTLLLAIVGCGRGPAEEALNSADETVAGLGEDVEMYASEELADLKQSLADARAKFDEGDYSAVMEAVMDLPAKAEGVKKAAMAKKEELSNSYTSMKESLGQQVPQIEARIEELAKSRRLRRSEGIDNEAVEAAKSGLQEAKDLWSQATSAFEGGDLQKAVEAGQAVKAKVEELMANLKMG